MNQRNMDEPTINHSSGDQPQMPSRETRIRDAAPKYRHLLTTLTQTNHAPPQLLLQQKTLTTLEADIVASDKRLTQSEALRLKEFQDHSKYRDSIVRRFAHKATGRGGKYESKAAREKDEYLSALQAEHGEREVNESLRGQLVAVKTSIPDLEILAVRHEQAQHDLTTLLDAIFAGSTPSHPDGASAEKKVHLAQTAYLEALTCLTAEYTAITHLVAAKRATQTAVSAMRDAISAAQLDLFTDRACADRREREALSIAETQLVSAKLAVMQAQRAREGIPDFPDIRIDQREIMQGMYFAAPGILDSGPTEVEKKVRGVEERIKGVDGWVGGLLEGVRGKEEVLRGKVEEREGEVKRAREELVRIRREVVERVLEIDK